MISIKTTGDNYIMMVINRGMVWGEHVGGMGNEKHVQNLSLENFKGRNHLRK